MIMKRILQLSVVFFLLFLTGKLQAQCPTPDEWGDVILASQAEVDDMAVTYAACTEIEGFLTIGDFDVPTDITSLAPLSNLTSIGGLGIYSTQITSLSGLNNLTHLTYGLSLGYNPQLDSLSDLENLNMGEDATLAVFDNPLLTSLTGLENLTAIWGIDINGSFLTSLSGLENLTSVTAIFIEDNTQLTDISALQNVDPATISGADWEGLLILDNPLLSVCNLPNFCTYLQGEGWRSISGNLGDCASEQAVIDACDAMSVEDIQANEMNIYPNPAKNHFTISNLSQNSDVKIMDMTGKVV